MDHLSTWNELSGVNLAFLPIGSIEQHGLHLPLGTDGIIATALARELSARFEPSYLLPLFPFSSSYEHVGFPGSISLRVSTLAACVKDIFDSLNQSGISRCVIITGHMGNHFLRNVVQELNIHGPRILLVPGRSHWDLAYKDAGLSSTTSQDMHAGEGETSLMMHMLPEYVRREYLKDINCPSRSLLETLGMKSYTDTGCIGFPTKASRDKGNALLQALVDRISSTVKEFVLIG